MSQSPQNNKNWLWITLSLVALAVLVLLLGAVIQERRAQQQVEDEFQANQEAINTFIENNPPMNRVELLEKKNSFFDN